MKIHPQIITKDNIPVFIVLSYEEYNSLLDALEDKEDIESVRNFHATAQQTIPFEELQSLAKGQNAVHVFRQLRQMSQTDLAKQVGISRQYLCQIEKGERQGSNKVLKKIAEVLNIDVGLLI